VATPGAPGALGGEGIGAEELLQRHITGDWGELCQDDPSENDLAAKEGFRILSARMLGPTN
jgi:hypothetical protein